MRPLALALATSLTAASAAAQPAAAPPGVRGLTVDVGAPASVQVFVGGVSKGVLSQPTTTLSAFGG